MLRLVVAIPSEGHKLTVGQNQSAEHITFLHDQLRPLEDLHHKYTSYQYAYSKLVLELARRRQYCEAAQRIVTNMMAQLDAMTEGASATATADISTPRNNDLSRGTCPQGRVPGRAWPVYSR